MGPAWVRGLEGVSCCGRREFRARTEKKFAGLAQRSSMSGSRGSGFAGRSQCRVSLFTGRTNAFALPSIFDRRQRRDVGSDGGAELPVHDPRAFSGSRVDTSFVRGFPNRRNPTDPGRQLRFALVPCFGTRRQNLGAEARAVQRKSSLGLATRNRTKCGLVDSLEERPILRWAGANITPPTPFPVKEGGKPRVSFNDF